MSASKNKVKDVLLNILCVFLGIILVLEVIGMFINLREETNIYQWEANSMDWALEYERYNNIMKYAQENNPGYPYKDIDEFSDHEAIGTFTQSAIRAKALIEVGKIDKASSCIELMDKVSSKTELRQQFNNIDQRLNDIIGKEDNK